MRQLATTASGRKVFSELSALSFQHPADLEAIEAIKKVPMAATIMRKVSELWTERLFYVKTIGDDLKLGPKQYPHIYEMYVEAGRILDVPVLPDLYLNTSYEVNAFAFGMKKYTISLNSGLVDLLDDTELMAVLGHELGHVKCEHMIYKSLAAIVCDLGADALTSFFGVTNLILLPIQAALFAWSRRAELSCDRAALLCTQDPDASARALAKLGGGGLRKRVDELSLEQVCEQAREYEKIDDSILTKGMQLYQSWHMTHPYPIYRAKMILDWSRGDDYAKILAGDYVTHAQAAAKRQGQATSCPRCAMALPANTAFCPGCGERMAMTTTACPGCRQPVDPSWAVCVACGVTLATGAKETACACGEKVKAGWRFCQKCGAPAGAQP
jgi:Zn-dependent protease with chaperone function